MVRFLTHRPIAVLVSTLALMVMGLVATQQLPISLMPDIEIPEITVKISYPNHTNRELENLVTKPVREALQTIPQLADLESYTRDGQAEIRLYFRYGTSVDLAFLEANEKVDQIMVSLPSDLARPNVIKASATDIPVFYLNLSLVSPPNKTDFETSLLQLSEFADQVIRRRLEQLPQVAMVDASGKLLPEIRIIPNQDELTALNLKIDDLEKGLKENNVSIGNLIVKDGQYQYNIRFASFLRTKEEVENIFFKVDNRLVQLKDFAKVELTAAERTGAYLTGGTTGIGMAIIKQADARMEDLRAEMEVVMASFQEEFPNINFEVSQDQTQLLEASISSLQQSLLLGGILAFLVLFLFLGDRRSPFLIGITIPVSLIISILCFYLLKLSINIISLSGLILGIGLMIDNAIIIIDNITQHRERNTGLSSSIVNGTREIIRPLISSTLTTAAVFLPLIFLSGIAGALFYDQAMAITIGLGSSLLVSITLLPTLYNLLHSRFPNRLKKTSPLFIYQKLLDAYEKSLNYLLNNSNLSLTIFLSICLLSILLYFQLPLNRLPDLSKQEILVKVDWNESISLEENERRVLELLSFLDTKLAQNNVQIGEQQFNLNKEQELTLDEALIYLKAQESIPIEILKKEIIAWFKRYFPSSLFHFSPPPDILEKLFGESTPPLVAKIRMISPRTSPSLEEMRSLTREINFEFGTELLPPAYQKFITINPIPEKLVLYEIDPSELSRVLRIAFRSYPIDLIKSNQQSIPIVLMQEEKSLDKIINQLTVINKKGISIPVSPLLRISPSYDYITLSSGPGGEFVPLIFENEEETNLSFRQELQKWILAKPNLDISFSGSIYSNQELLQELLVILIVSLFLLYFILAAQFESLSQPFIVLIEVPIDLSGAFLFLWLSGSSLNLMSMIGIIVMSGIIINDSILKIDTINQLKVSGLGIMEAILEGGKRRFKPIIMTSLTTILAASPFLFQKSLGADLQKPLALALIGGMILGTVVSLYFIPIAYKLLQKASLT